MKRLFNLVLFGALLGNPALTLAHDDPTSPDHHHGSGTNVMTTRPESRILPPPKSDDVFHFVVYGDRTGGVPAGLKVLEQAVEDTNLLDPDLVMTVGDLIQGYNQTPEWMQQMKEFQAIADRLKMKWYPVAGNHDVYWRGNGPAPPGHHEANYEKHFGPLWYSFQHKNAGFVVLYSDEGDPKTNQKAFNVGALQNMSDEQLAFLDKALAQLKHLDHVFVFLHHPRWIGGGYRGSNWEVVHKKLAAAGNVSAVFAGHIHHMRYDGKQDGIEYYALATTGGNLSAEIPDAGYLHHLNVVTVRKERISVSALPIGAVMDPKQFTPEFLAEVDAARKVRPIQKSSDLLLEADGSARGDVQFVIENTSPRSIDATVSIDPRSVSLGWRTTLDHQHFELQAGESRSIDFTVARNAGDPGQATVPSVRMDMDYLGENTRVRLPEVIAPIGLRLGQVPADYFSKSTPHCLEVTDPQAAIRVESDEFKLPNGPMTLEAWVKPTNVAGYNGVIAKTESSDYAIFSDEGVPEFSIHLQGTYRVAKATKLMPTGRWTHVAGVYDGEAVKLYVDGELVDSTRAKGKRRTNKFPLFVGADPDGRGRPTRSFAGLIDEVRLSKVGRYSDSFQPAKLHQPDADTVFLFHLDRAVGPFVLDHSSSSAKGVLGRNSRLVEVAR